MPEEHRYIALNRFGLGTDKQGLSALGSGVNLPEAKSWLIHQLKAYSLPKSEWTSEQAIKANHELRERRNERDSNPDMQSDFISIRRKYIEQARNAAVDTLVYGTKHSQSLQARLLAFFSNHFSVTRQNLPMTLLAPTLETEAIAPNLHLHFSDMLVAVTKHPAMLLYLNNEGSVGPNSKVGKARFKKKRSSGLNENLAREILELHTLGVGGPYSQSDVIELAKGLSGWSIGAPHRKEAPGFKFRLNAHEPGTRKVLNKKYKPTPEGISTGEAILHYLANHQACANHICTKLAQHFVTDQAPENLVDSMSREWIKTQGHLPSVLTAMIKHNDSWRIENKKFKTPREFVLSSLRAMDKTLTPNRLFQTFELMGHGLFNSGSPAGFPDTQRAWLSTSALNTRIEWTSQLAEVMAKRKAIDPVKLANEALGPFLQERTLDAIKKAESKQMALAILLMSPEFQRR